MTQAIPAQGVVLSYDDAGTQTPIGEVSDISGPGGQATVIDASHLGSKFKEKLMGLADEGQVTASVNLVPDDAGQKAMRTARANQTKTDFVMALTDSNATELSFTGYVLGFTISASSDDKITGEITIEVTGQSIYSNV